jgi:hypothetical protein
MPTPLSPNFDLDKMVVSQTASRLGIDNTPSPEIISDLSVLCLTLLEPARALLGVPFHINSGYRCPALNQAVGGARTSAHLDGRAADCVPEGLDLEAAFDTLRKSDLPYDQIIFECREWIHLGMAKDGVAPRRQALTATGGPGHWAYQEA